MISPAKTAADSRYWRSIKYSLFPPLGLATLAGYLDPDDEVDLQDEHVETLRPRRRARPRRDPGLHHLGRRAYRIADHYRAQGRLRLPRRAARRRALPGGGGRATPTRSSCGPGRGHLARVPARLPRRAAASRSTARPCARWTACRRRAATSSSATSTWSPNSLVVSPRLPAPLRLLLQGVVLPRRQVVLHAGGRRGAGGDRAPARAAPLLPGRPPASADPPLRRGALRRHAGHGPGLAGGRRRCEASCAGPDREGGRARACGASSSASRR